VSGFYCIAPRARQGRKWQERSDQTADLDLYAPGTPDYRSRAQETATQLACGLVRIDLGEPVKRLACEAQPVTRSIPAEPLAAKPAEAPLPLPVPVTPSKAEPHWRDSYGLGRGR